MIDPAIVVATYALGKVFARMEDDQALIDVRDDKRELEEKLHSPHKDPWARVDLLGSNGGKLKTEGGPRSVGYRCPGDAGQTGLTPRTNVAHCG